MAGGIYTREDMEHYLALGISGVQMATRFVTTYECDADDAYKQCYIRAHKEDIMIVQSPVGMPGRAIRNPFIEKAKAGQIPHGRCHSCISACNPAKTPYCITAVVSSFTSRRSLIPVLLLIHSSDVSIIFDRSSFVTTISGRQLPVPMILVLIIIYPSFSLAGRRRL